MPQGYQDPACTVFVSNVSDRVTEEILWELFLQAGPLKNVYIPLDREKRKQRSYAFVTFQHDVSVPYACELFNTLQLFQRSIYCKPATNDSKSNETEHSTPPSSRNLSFESSRSNYSRYSSYNDDSCYSAERNHYSGFQRTNSFPTNYDYRESPGGRYDDFFQVNSAVQRLRYDDFSNSPSRYGPQRDTYIPQHRQHRREFFQPY